MIQRDLGDGTYASYDEVVPPPVPASSPVLKAKAGHHLCPREGCTAQVPNERFACRADWFSLPNEVRRKILATAHLGVLTPRRRSAFRAAELAWGDRS